MEKSIVVRGELRAESQGEKFEIGGYAALFNSPSKNLGGFVEWIAPEAFDRALREKQVVRFTFNHSMDAVLARTDNGTLALSTDPKGLRFKAQLNRNIQQHKDIFEACKAGLYNECSFAFTVTPKGQTWSFDNTQRTLTDVDLLDCSIVGNPAYEGTSASARSTEIGRETLLARVLAMPGDWARQEKARALKIEIDADKIAALAPATKYGNPSDEDIDDMRDALVDKFGQAEHGLTPLYWPIEIKQGSVVVVDMNSYGGDYYLIPCTQTDEGGLVFGLPEALDAYLPKGRAAVRAHEARDVKADGNLKFRMQVAAGLR